MWRRIFKVPPPDADPEAARRELERAERDQEMVEGRWAFIHNLTADMADKRRVNHFAARLRAAYGEGR